MRYLTNDHRRTLTMTVLVVTAVAAASGVAAQKAAPADVAAKMSGTWKVNRELSQGLGAPGRGGPGSPGRGGAVFAIAGGLGQRGGGRGGGGGDTPVSASELPPDVLAAQAAIRDLQQIGEIVTIKATADSIAFADPRGERSYAIDNKTAKIDAANGAKLEVKTKWDKAAVRQEFSSAQTRLVRSWEVDDQNHLVLKTKIESMTMNSKEVKAVYDRQ